MRKHIILLFLFMLFLTGCQQSVVNSHSHNKVGLLVPTTINDPIWGNKGYKGLLKIQSSLETEVFYKEQMKTEEDVRQAVEEFSNKGVTLLFGHGKEYEPFFKEIHSDYPHIQFVYFNGNFTAENVVSIKFEAYAIGFFAGMVAAEMSDTKRIGIIGAFEWQPEIKGFMEGATYQKPDVMVDVQYTYDWDDVESATTILANMIASDVDVVYPTGDAFNIPVIEKVKEEGLYVIGFMSDQIDFGEATVLTSTVQHVDLAYEKVANQFFDGQLPEGIITYNFENDIISMGKFSPTIPEAFKQRILLAVDHYSKTGELPNKQSKH